MRPTLLQSTIVSAAFLGLASGVNLQAAITDGLVAHLTFDGDYNDTSGKGANGTAQGTPTFEAGSIGQAVHLTSTKDLATNNYVSLGYPDSLKFGSDATGDTKDISFSFWVKVFHQADDQAFIGNKDWSGGGNHGFVICSESDGMKWNWADDSGSGRRDSAHAGKNVVDGSWHHVVVTFQRSGDGLIYVDSALVNTTSVAPSPDTPVGSIDTDVDGLVFNLGQDGTGGYTDGGSAEIDMLMDDLGIWSRVLTPSEIYAIYNSGLSGKNLAEVPVNVDPFIASATPANNAANVDPGVTFTATIQNAVTAVNTNSIKLYFNGAAVTPALQSTTTNTVLSYTPPALLASQSTNAVRIEYANNAATPATFTNTITFVVAAYTNIVLGTPLYSENFDSTEEGALPAGWTVVNHTDDGDSGEDLNNPKSDSYKNWVVISRQRVSDITAWNASYRLSVPAGIVVNGKVVSSLVDGNFIYAESDQRGGSQVQYLFSPKYDLTGKTNIYLSYYSVYEQNQDNIGAVEYSVDGGANWLPVVYMLDTPDIVHFENGDVDAVSTFNADNSDTASYTDPDTGETIGGTYGAFIAAPIAQSLAPYISARVNDDSLESKRVEVFPLPEAANKSQVTFRFAQAGTGSWFFGFDNFALYSFSSTPEKAPSLSIARNGAQVTVSWDSAATGYTLQTTATLTSPSWTTVSGVANNSVTLSTTGTAQFYRLTK